MKRLIPLTALTLAISLFAGRVMNELFMHESAPEWITEALIAGVASSSLMVFFTRERKHKLRDTEVQLPTIEVLPEPDAELRTQQNRA